MSGCPFCPGTDTAFCLGMMYHHGGEQPAEPGSFWTPTAWGSMPSICPRGPTPRRTSRTTCWAPTTSEPKTPEWAEAICGVPAADYRAVSPRRSREPRRSNFFAGQSTTKIPAGEMFGQAFYTSGHHARRPRHPGQLCLRWLGLHEHGYVRHALLLSPAMSSNGAGKNPVNPLAPPRLIVLAPELGSRLTDHRLLGEGRPHRVLAVHSRRAPTAATPGPAARSPSTSTSSTRAPIENSLNSLPNANAGIKVFRKVDFVWGAASLLRCLAPILRHCAARGNVVGEGQHSLDA